MKNSGYSTFWLGEMPYTEALSYQTKLADKVRVSSKGVVLGLEHPAVITTGMRIQDGPSSINGVEVIKTNRGGQTTCHNPGQLVIYPIVPLKIWNLTVRQYVEILLETTQNFIKSCNIIIDRTDKGVFTSVGKIASVGINIKKGISTHGVAINVHNDLSLFDLISPCGVGGQKMDKIENYKEIGVAASFDLWSGKFWEVLQQKNVLERPSDLAKDFPSSYF